MSYLGLKGGEGGYTQSALSRAADASTSGASYYVALTIALIYMRAIAAFSKEEREEEEEDQDSQENVSVEYEGDDKESRKSSVDRVAQADPLVIVQIGDKVLEERASLLEDRLRSEELSEEEVSSFRAAMNGETPSLNVSITTKNDVADLQFAATPVANLGWTVENSSIRVSQSEIVDEYARQQSSELKSIKTVMHDAMLGDGVTDSIYAAHGEHEHSVLVTPEAVFVFNKNGLVVDSVEIDEVKNKVESEADLVNGHTRYDQTREALKDFPGAEKASTNAAIPKTRRSRQNELTPQGPTL